MGRYEEIKESADYIKSKAGNGKIDIAIVLGSGLGDLAEELGDAVAIPYGDIPHFPVSTVKSHKGRLVIGSLEGKRVVCMQGRFHYYEGYSMQDVVTPIEAFGILSVGKLFLTNAAGCVNTAWKPGDLMAITDHIKLAIDSPMRGKNDERLGERFFDMCSAWDKEAIKVAKKEAGKLSIPLREGVYMLFGGPQFETPAEIRMARMLGADAVGMSTVPEAIAAAHMGMRTVGISCLTNMAAGIDNAPLSHVEVIETSEGVKRDFQGLVKAIVREWA